MLKYVESGHLCYDGSVPRFGTMLVEEVATAADFCYQFYDQNLRLQLLQLVFLLFRCPRLVHSVLADWHSSDANIPSCSLPDFLQRSIYNCGNARVFNTVQVAFWHF